MEFRRGTTLLTFRFLYVFFSYFGDKYAEVLGPEKCTKLRRWVLKFDTICILHMNSYLTELFALRYGLELQETHSRVLLDRAE